jgi:hypothetical protein
VMPLFTLGDRVHLRGLREDERRLAGRTTHGPVARRALGRPPGRSPPRGTVGRRTLLLWRHAARSADRSRASLAEDSSLRAGASLRVSPLQSLSLRDRDLSLVDDGGGIALPDPMPSVASSRGRRQRGAKSR